MFSEQPAHNRTVPAKQAAASAVLVCHAFAGKVVCRLLSYGGATVCGHIKGFILSLATIAAKNSIAYIPLRAIRNIITITKSNPAKKFRFVHQFILQGFIFSRKKRTPPDFLPERVLFYSKTFHRSIVND